MERPWKVFSINASRVIKRSYVYPDNFRNMYNAGVWRHFDEINNKKLDSRSIVTNNNLSRNGVVVFFVFVDMGLSILV